MEDKGTSVKKVRMAANIPRTGNIVVNRNRAKKREAGKPEDVKKKTDSRVTGRLVKDIQKSMKSQEDEGMTTLSYGITAAIGVKKTYDAVHTLNTGLQRVPGTISKTLAEAGDTKREIGQLAKSGNKAALAKGIGKYGARAVGRPVSYVIHKTGSSIKKIGNYGLNYTVSSMAQSENDGVRVMGKTAKAMQYLSLIKKKRQQKVYSVKKSNPAPKAAGISLGGRKNLNVRKEAGNENSKREQQYIRRNAYKNKWSKSARGRASKVVQKAGNSVTTALAQAASAAGKKAICFLAAIVVVAAAVFVIVGGAGAVVAVIFSPFLSDDTGEEVDEIAWLQANITRERNDLIKDVKDVYDENLVTNGGEYHYVRFFNNFTSTEIPLTDTNINTSIYSVSEYQQYIQPIFHTIIFSEYELEASDRQMKDVLENIWDNLSKIKTEELPMEWCHMIKTDNADGTYTITPVKDADGQIHAIKVGCPNMGPLQYHDDDASLPLSSCDNYYYECDGHEGECEHSCNDDCAGGCSHQCGTECANGCTHTCDSSCDEYCGHTHQEWKSASNPGCHGTDYCGSKMETDCGNSTKHLECEGYYVCNGHKILALSVELKDFSDLLNTYFLQEIQTLEAKAPLTPEENTRLQDLKGYYEICLEYTTILAEEYGFGGGTVVELDDVVLTPLTSYACSFIGNPYVWGGKDPHIGADCSGFVQYVYAHFGVPLPRVSKEQVTVGNEVGSLADARPGDLIFYSSDGTDEGVYHVTIYLGSNKMVHASNSRPYPNGGIKVSTVYGIIYKIKRIS